MIWAIAGIILGIILGITFGFAIPIEYTKYSAIVIVGILDALFGAVKADITKEDYNLSLFLTGLSFNIILALLITFMGEKMGLELYLAVAVVFIFRIFSNLGIVRRAIIKKFIKNKK